MPEEIANPLLSLIRDQGMIDDLQYEEVAAEHKRSGTPVIQILQDFGIMDLDTILQVISNYMGAEVVNLNEKEFPPELIKTIPPRTARMYRCFPVEAFDSTLRVAFEDPLNPARVDELGFMVKGHSARHRQPCGHQPADRAPLRPGRLRERLGDPEGTRRRHRPRSRGAGG